MTGVKGTYHTYTVYPIVVAHAHDSFIHMNSFFRSLRFEKIIPAVLSLLIPGLGQVIKGQIIKAFMIWVLGSLISYYTWGKMTMVVPILFWIWNVYDAYSD